VEESKRREARDRGTQEKSIGRFLFYRGEKRNGMFKKKSLREKAAGRKSREERLGGLRDFVW